MSNEIIHHMDWLPTFLAAAGAEDIKERLKKGGVNSMGRSYKVHHFRSGSESTRRINWKVD